MEVRRRKFAAVVPANPSLSDLAYEPPWRAAVRGAAVSGRLPRNRFVLGGNPLLGTAQADATSDLARALAPCRCRSLFSCAFTSSSRFSRATSSSAISASTGCADRRRRLGFSAYVVFWVGWSVGPSTATFPLLLLGLRRIARGRRTVG
jgi:hypothetical protein